MFDIVRKSFLWEVWNNGLEEEIEKRHVFHLKSIQDLAIYSQIKDNIDKNIAEVGGGNSRILSKLALRNKCYNVEKFEGQHGGPNKEIELPGVTNIPVFLGEYSGKLKRSFFDIVFSISVIEHVPEEMLDDFLNEGVSILKPGGLWLHAIDIYIEDTPDNERKARFNRYRDWLDHDNLEPVGNVYNGPLQFSCDMATNPDDEMFQWGQFAPSLIPLRQRAQSVSIIIAARKK